MADDASSSSSLISDKTPSDMVELGRVHQADMPGKSTSFIFLILSYRTAMDNKFFFSRGGTLKIHEGPLISQLIAN